MLISDGLYFFKKTFFATSSEACALTPRKCFAEEGKNVRKLLEKHKLFWSHFFAFAFRILASEIVFFLTFSKSERIFGDCFQFAQLQKICD